MFDFVIQGLICTNKKMLLIFTFIPLCDHFRERDQHINIFYLTYINEAWQCFHLGNQMLQLCVIWQHKLLRHSLGLILQDLPL